MSTVSTALADQVCVITLNRPENLNAITMGLLHDLNSALVEAQTATDVACIVLTGEGRAFCAGDDLKAQGEILEEGIAAVARQIAAIQEVTSNIMFGPKPVIGAVEGWAVGAGLSWTLNCDLTVWGESARGFFPEVGYGTFFSGGATYLLPQRVGQPRAADIMFSGRKVPAAEFLQMGWASHIAPSGGALAEATRLAGEIAAKPSDMVRWVKRALCEPTKGLLLAAIANESAACLEAAGSEDTAARMKAALKGNEAQ